MQGREHLAAISLWSGADGVISAMANIAPRLLQALAASMRDERPRAEILALQARDRASSRRVFDQGDWLAGLKVTLQALGWDVGEPSPPIPPYDAEQRRVVRGHRVERPRCAAWLTTSARVPAPPHPARRRLTEIGP